MTMRCSHGLGHSDAAKRFADNVNMHYQAIGWDAVGKFIALNLADGSSDHVLYDTHRDAVRHQHNNEMNYHFVKIIPTAMTVCEAQILLDVSRKAHDAGFRLTDPDHKQGGRTLIMRGRPVETVSDQLRRLLIASRSR